MEYKKCPKCGSDDVDENWFCGRCGYDFDTSEEATVNIIQDYNNNIQIQQQAIDTWTTSEDLIKCPKCGSTQITAGDKGFGLGKAALGGVLLGPVGLLGGMIGSKKVMVTCLRCGTTWEAGKEQELRKKIENSEMTTSERISQNAQKRILIRSDKDKLSAEMSTNSKAIVIAIIFFLISIIVAIVEWTDHIKFPYDTGPGYIFWTIITVIFGFLLFGLVVEFIDDKKRLNRLLNK